MGARQPRGGPPAGDRTIAGREEQNNVGKMDTAAAAGKGGNAEHGAGTVLVLGAGMLLLILCMAVLLLLQTAVAASRAATAADLAALAAADTVRELRLGDPCQVAGEVAARNGAVLASCSVDTGEQTVQVETEVPVPLLPQPATGHARAGPPPDTPAP